MKEEKNLLDDDVFLWLSVSEDYHPPKDRDRFVDKSIMSILGIIGKLKSKDSGNRKERKVNATVQVAFTFVFLILISLSRNIQFLRVMGVYVLLLISMMEGKQILRVLRLTAGGVLFSAVIMLPAFFMGNGYSSIMTVFKVALTVSMVGIISQSLDWVRLTGTLKLFFLPDLLLFVIDIAVRYIILLGEYTLETLYALRLRMVGKNNKKYQSLSGVAGNLFLTSRIRAEEMVESMECRGFSGEYHRTTDFHVGWYDFLFLTVQVVLIGIYIYFARL